MQPADEYVPEALIGRRVAFKTDAEHEGCWHVRVGLKTGVVLKLGQSLSQKAELLGAEVDVLAELFSAEFDVPRLWVRADPCESFPRGCETAVERACLMVVTAAP